MTERGTWKASERRMAEALGGVRVPVTGRQRGAAPDIAHETYAIERESHGCSILGGPVALMTPRPVTPEVSPMQPDPTTLTRFWSKVEVGPDGPLGHCLVWSGSRQPRGYGAFRYMGKTALAHRVAYEWERGAVPDGLDLDHLCRTRCCIRADHLEAVTHRVNVLRGEAPSSHHSRKTHCPKGHPYDEVNTRLYDGRRYCRACENSKRSAK